MFRAAANLFRSFVQPMTREVTPHQLALAVAIGVSIGLVPKFNLIALAWLTLLFTLRVNLLLGLMTACLAALTCPLVDPYLHILGDWLLRQESLQSLFTGIYRLPLGPWTSINNTVVVGASVIGLIQFFPTYRLSKTLFAKHASQLKDHWLAKACRTEAATGWRI